VPPADSTASFLPYASTALTVVLAVLQVRSRNEVARLGREQAARAHNEDAENAKRAAAEQTRLQDVRDLNVKLEKIMERRESDVKTLETQVHQVTERMIDERLRRITHTIDSQSQALVGITNLFTEHTKASDLRFRNLELGGSAAEKALVQVSSDLREWVRKEAAGKESFDDFCDETRESRKQILDSIDELKDRSVGKGDLVEALTEALNANR
jgi:hypothetical protein